MWGIDWRICPAFDLANRLMKLCYSSLPFSRGIVRRTKPLSRKSNLKFNQTKLIISFENTQNPPSVKKRNLINSKLKPTEKYFNFKQIFFLRFSKLRWALDKTKISGLCCLKRNYTSFHFKVLCEIKL